MIPKGKQYDSLNEVIDQYSKDKTMNLRDKVVPSQEHIKTYESQGKDLRRAHINRKKIKKEQNELEKLFTDIFIILYYIM